MENSHVDALSNGAQNSLDTNQVAAEAENKVESSSASGCMVCSTMLSYFVSRGLNLRKGKLKKALKYVNRKKGADMKWIYHWH